MTNRRAPSHSSNLSEDGLESADPSPLPYNARCPVMVPRNDRTFFSGDNLRKVDSFGHVPLKDTVDVAPLLLTAGFTDVTYNNTWATISGRYDVGYYKDPQTALVHLRGICGGGTGTIFTLPTALRPKATVELAVNSNSAYGSILIQTDGQVIFINGDASKVSLDGVVFDVSVA